MATNQTNEAGVRSQSRSGLTLEDAFICIDKTTWLESRAYIAADSRDAQMFADRETLNRVPPHDGTSCGMTTVQAMKRRIDFRITAEDDLEPWAVY